MNSLEKSPIILRRRNKLHSLVWFFLKMILWFNVISFVLVISYRFLPVPTTVTMISRSIALRKIVNYTWKSYDEISSWMPLALVANEDQNFPTHNGFDWKGISDAYAEQQAGTRFRGGSTISQQTAKNVFLWQGQSYLRKGIEVYYTFLIERLWTKERILEVYMNVAETGAETFGVEAASQKYFKKSAEQLTKEQAAQIAGIFPSPRKWNINNNSRKNRILKQMNNLGSGYLKKIEKEILHLWKE